MSAFTEVDDLLLDLSLSVDLGAPPALAWEAMLHRLSEGNVRPDGVSLNMKLERHCGGRWYRDRGEGVEHLWGFVQVIKAPVLLEIQGPMFMSYPALNHLEFKIEEAEGGCRALFRHRAIGTIDPQHREGVGHGWGHFLEALKGDCA